MASFYEELQKSDLVSDEKENIQSRLNVDRWIFRLFLLLLGGMPLIVLANVEQVISPVISNIEMLATGTKGELFTHFKSLFTIVITLIAWGLLLSKVFFMEGTIRKTYLNYVLAIFALIIVLSTILSPNISIALNGTYNRSEGAISWLCYISLMFVAMNIEYPKNLIKYIMYTFIPFVYINLIIISMNFFGNDLLQYSIVRSIVSMTLPEGAAIGESSQLVGTLNQWNYMSGMFAVMTTMYLAWTIASKKLTDTIIGAITASASLAILFMSISTSGFLTLLVTSILLVLLFIKAPKKKNATIGIVLFFIISASVFHLLAKENDSVWRESFGFIINSNPYEENIKNTNSYLDSFKDKTVYAAEQSFELPVLPEKGWSPGTGRLYIWDKTLDLVKERPILGYGLDSIMYNFPHYNIDSRGGNNDENTIVDKPHNLYLGILYGTGIIGMLSLIIILVGVSLITIKKIFTKNKIELGIFLIGIFAFAIQAMFNDTLPGMTSVLFILSGMLVLMQEDTQQFN